MRIDNQEAMQIAFEQFMLGNSNSDHAKSSDDTHLFIEKQKKEKLQKENEVLKTKFNQKVKKLQKNYWQLFKSFLEIVEKEWLAIDNQMENVVKSISNIRNRLPLEICLIKKNSKHVYSSLHGENPKAWCDHGLRRGIKSFHGSSNFLGIECYLNQSDIQQTISHDLIQHEKMMIALRSLHSNMSDSQQKLGKYVEEITKLHIDNAFEISIEWKCNILDKDEKKYSSSSSNYPQLYPMHLINDMNEVLMMLSSEFYRKQILLKLVLDSTTDDLLNNEDENRRILNVGEIQIDLDRPEDLCPRFSASLCSMQWSRSSIHSAVDIPCLAKILKSAEKY